MSKPRPSRRSWHTSRTGLRALGVLCVGAALVYLTVVVTGDSLARRWAHRTGVPVELLEADLGSTRLSVAVALLLALAAGIAACWRAASASREPIAELTNLVSRIAERGDLGGTIDVGPDHNLAELAAALGRLLERLRHIPAHLEASMVDLRGAVTGLTDLTRSRTASVQRQASSLAEASATTQEIKQTSGLAASKAKTVFEIAEKAEEFSIAGQSAIEASLSGLQDIRAQVEAIVARIANLSDKTVQVGEIIESVKDLADQSHILALNAAIEASKAGEFGKSFAVVAREMRSLADQSIQNTGRIREILSEIQDAIRSTVAITEEGTRKMEHSMEQIRVSGENLREMTAIVQQSSQAAQQIAATVGQQNAGIEQISGSLHGLNSVMEETMRGIKQAEAAVENLKATSLRFSGFVEASRT